MSEYTELVERAELAATSAKISAAQTKSDKDTVVSLYNEIKAIIDAGGGTGGSCKFYECATVTETLISPEVPAVPAGITVLADPDLSPQDVVGFYEPQGDTSDLASAVWKNTKNEIRIYKSPYEEYWVMTVGSGFVTDSIFYAPYTAGRPPWESTWSAKNAWGYPQMTGSLIDTPAIPAVVEKLWSGYEWLLVDGLYEKSTDITSDLVWTSVKPVVGKSYNSNALVQVTVYTGSIDIEGQVLYEPLQDTIGTFTSDFTPTFQTIEGIKCCHIPYSSRLYSTEKLPVGSGAFSISFWMKPSTMPSEMWSLIIGDNSSYNGGIRFRYYGNSIKFDSISSDLGSIDDVTVTDWNFFTIIYTGTSIQVYINGVSKLNTSISSFDLSSGYAIGHTDNSLDGYVASFRAFNRVLDEDDINTLYGEFSK